ncbi:hypothetical protein ELQ94_13155 [Labedella endophytica]|uniref:DUF2029 domain-containing protein n=1 Tax=Labedella endophytica TaxID=1523160 RepID=A0A433JQS3_9MICO|nr:hypothetical protein ELQ94_13155 [Labedella endophytica]
MVVIVVFAAARAVTTAFMLVLAAAQPENAWTAASPRYIDFASMWDGRWYNIIAVSGYPTVLPLTDDGHVGENAWAFMPVYPFVARIVMSLTGAEWALAAVGVSLAAGFGAALVTYRLFRERLDAGASLFGVVVFSVAPVSPLFQVAYAESLHLLLLAVALLLLLRRHYLLLIPVVVVMGFTRPSGLAFALLLVLHVGIRVIRRRQDPFARGDLAAATILAVVSGVVGLGWPASAWAVTGSITAYTDTELAWRSAYIGYQHLVPFTPWFQSLEWWTGSRWGWVVVVAIVIAFVAMMLSRPVRALGLDLRLWLASYALYLFAVFFPQSSTFRLLLPLFPLAAAIAVPRSRIYRVLVVAVSLVLQWGWLLIAWRVDGYDWTPP